MILTGENNETLRKKSTEVDLKKSKEIIKKLFKNISKKEAAGLAAPQIGENYRVVLVQNGDDFMPMINPKITSFSVNKEIDEEGCLSLPNIWGKVPRHSEIEVQYINEQGEKIQKRFSGWTARVIQHEIDHLDGVLFIDRVTEENSSLSNLNNLQKL